MRIVTVNSGSTSVKLAEFESQYPADVTLIRKAHHSGEALDPAQLLRAFVRESGAAPVAIAHRVVHGGTRFKGPVRIDADVLTAIQQLSQLAPLHNPKALEWIAAAQSIVSADVAQVAAFDTSFFFALPRVAAEYALPAGIGVNAGVRRYGFHGLAHEAMWRRWNRLHPELPAGGKLISLQLGGGCSIAAIDGGRPLDTSMGFSPLEGLVMETRCGDLDPAVVPYLQNRLGIGCADVVARLNRECGVAGLSGGRTLLEELAADPSAQAQFTVDLYCYRARKYIGAYLAVLGGCDGIVFGGGVGEHVAAVRGRILAGFTWAGIEIDPVLNDAARGSEARLSHPGQRTQVWVIPVEEEPMLARAAALVLKSA